MSSTTKKEQRSERARKVAEMQAAQARAERRRRLGVAGAIVVAVLLVVGVVVYIGLNSTAKDDTKATGKASAAVVKAVTGVPEATLDSVGVGSTTAQLKSFAAPPLTEDGKPRVLYDGAEYCPYCAAQRWAVTVALSRFGTFSGLGQTESSSVDTLPNTATLSFHGATYSSKYLAFTGYEETTNQQQGSGYKPLDKLSAADQKVVDTYNKPPYVAGSGGSIPFVDLGGKFVTSGATYDASLLQGQTHLQIAQALADPSSKIAQGVDGTANVYTAGLCDLTGGKPTNVCTAKGVVAAATNVSGQ